MGAAISGLMLHLGDRLGLYQAMAGSRADHVGRRWQSAPEQRAVRPGVARQPGGRRLRRLRPGRHHLRAARGAGHGRRRRAEPGLPRRRVRDHRVLLRRPRHVRRRLPHRRGSRLARPRRAAVLRRQRLFRPGYAAHLVAGWLPALDGVVDKLRSGANVADVGCGLRCVHHHHGRGLRALDVCGLRPPRAFDRGSSRRRGRGRRQSRAHFEVATAKDFPGTGLRPGLPVRRPARHGRPGRCWPARSGRRWRPTAR